MPPDNEDLDEVLKMVSVLMRDGNLSSSNTADQVTAEDAKDTGKESQEEPTSHEHPTLETLPNEIISSIAGMLAVGIDEPYVVSRPALTTSENRQQEDARARRDLTSLCMVSKRMASNAQKALYRNVLITDANILILLYRTFLENSKLAIHVKRMSLNIDHGMEDEEAWCYLDEDWRVFNGKQIYLSPLLSCAQHGLGNGFAEAVKDSTHALPKIPVEQFRVLGHASNLESLDVNVHPFLPLIRAYTNQKMEKRHWQEVGVVLCSVWKEVLPRLSRVKKLQMIGNHEPFEVDEVQMARQLFSVRICRCFLKLPSLEKLVWVNYSESWFSTLPFLMVSGINTESRFESVKVLELKDSPGVPQGLDTICSAFPNLESLSVENGYRHEYFEPSQPELLDADEDLTGDTGGRCLTDSLTALQNLKTLRLDLHHFHEISGALGPSGTLTFAGLPNLETLEMPFHFFASSVPPEGYHQVVVSESTLPRALSSFVFKPYTPKAEASQALKTLKITACYECDYFNSRAGFDFADAAHRYWPPPYEHGDTVLKFLEMLASFHDEYFPSLEYLCYEEVQLKENSYDRCPGCRRTVHLKNTRGCEGHLEVVKQLLHQKGVVFEHRPDQFFCLGAGATDSWLSWAAQIEQANWFDDHEH